MAKKKQAYVIRYFLNGEESGELHKEIFEGIDGYMNAERWIDIYGNTIEIFSERWEMVDA